MRNLTNHGMDNLNARHTIQSFREYAPSVCIGSSVVPGEHRQPETVYCNIMKAIVVSLCLPCIIEVIIFILFALCVYLVVQDNTLEKRCWHWSGCIMKFIQHPVALLCIHSAITCITIRIQAFFCHSHCRTVVTHQTFVRFICWRFSHCRTCPPDFHVRHVVERMAFLESSIFIPQCLPVLYDLWQYWWIIDKFVCSSWENICEVIFLSSM